LSPRVHRLAFGACLLVAAAAHAFDDGLLTNGDFVATTNPWQHTNPTTGQLDYSTLDATGEPGSGSALITNFAAVDSAGDDAFLCVGGIVPGATYAFGGQILIETGVRTGYATLHGGFHAVANCSDSASGGNTTSTLSSAFPDVFYPRRGPDLVAPAGAVAFKLYLHTLKHDAGGSLLVHFDDVYLCPVDGTCGIFDDGFESGDHDAWSSDQP
jgi:hypothetical protein